MTWAVIIFPTENAVEVVAISWYINQSKECFWPPKNVKKSVLVKQIQNCEEPDVDWVAHSAKLLGQYDCLDIAQKKARRAEEETDVSSSDVGRGVRKPKPNSRYANTSSEDDNESSEEDEFPKFTPQKAFRSVCTIPKSSSIKNKNKLQPERVLAPASNSYGKSQCVPEAASETVSAAHTSCQPNKNDVVETALFTTSKPQLAIEKDVQKILQEELSLINMKLDLIIDRLKVNERNIYFPTELNKKGIEEFFNKIPVQTNECLTNLEDSLTVKENYNIAVLQLSRIGGSTMPQATRKSLYRMLGNEATELFSWDGAKKKRPFKNLSMAKVLLDSIKMTFLDAKEDEIIGIIKIWLVKAKERMKERPQNEDQNHEELGE